MSGTCFAVGPLCLVVVQPKSMLDRRAASSHEACAPSGNDSVVKRCPQCLQSRICSSMHFSLSSSGGAYSEWSLRPSAMGDKKKNRKRKNSGDLSDFPTRTLKQYSIDEKLEIIDFAKNNGNRAAGREYNVAESSIREWRKNEQKLRSLNETDPDRSRLSGGGRRLQDNVTPTGDEIDSEVSVQVPLSLVLPSGSTDVSENNDQEASLGANSNNSTHSNSPTLSVSSINGCAPCGGSSSRRKAKQPKKLICEEVVSEVTECA